MKYTKRVVSLFIIATMILSMLSAFIAVPVMATIGVPFVWNEDGTWEAEGNTTMPIYKGTKLLVNGTGVVGGETVNVYWDYAQAAYLLNSTTADNFGDYECLITVPAAYNGSHTVWVKDLQTGLSEVIAGALNIWAKVSLDPDAGLSGDEVTVSGYGFNANEMYNVSVYGGGLVSHEKLWGANDDETDDDGSFTYTFDIPSWIDNPYDVNATDETGTTAEDGLTIGPAIAIDVDSGPSGTIVKVEGRGFNASMEMYPEDNFTIWRSGVGYDVDTKNGLDVTTSGSGTFTAYLVIPSVPAGDYVFNITDGVKTAKDDFEVDGEADIDVTPEYGTPGTVLTVKGYNFTQVSGTDVDLTLMGQTAETSCDANGEFTASITIPPLDFGTEYNVTAEDEKNCWANQTVLVALIVLQLSDYSAPVGSAVTLMGSGFTSTGEWNATFGDIDLITSTALGGQTYFSDTFYVPTIPSGTYTIGVLDVDEDITVGIDFTVTDQAALDVSREDVPNGYNLTIEGINFAELNNTVTEWYIYNSTDAWNIDDNVTELHGPTPPETDTDGEFTAWYMMPEFLALGSYCINTTTISNAATDPDVIQWAEVCIEIVPEEVILNVGNPSYARGQTITFVVKATLKKDPFYLGIKDPDGSEVFNSTWDVDDWKTIGAWYYIPSNLQIDDNIADVYSLPADAMAGTWTYSFWDDDKEYGNGTFSVTELTEIEQLTQDIGEVMAGIEGMGTSNTELAELVADLGVDSAAALDAAAAAAAAAADAKDAADASTAAIADVEDTSNAALDAANDAKSAADAAKTAADSGLDAANDAKATAQAAADAATDAKDAAETTQQQTSGLTTLVYGAIGASLIAALAAIVSLMQISRRIAG